MPRPFGWNPVSLVVIAGLFYGSQTGVMGITWLAVRSGVAELPCGVGRQDFYGAALLAGIGFTMSLFVATLAFADPTAQGGVKLAIIVGSLLSAMAGIGWLCQARRAPSG